MCCGNSIQKAYPQQCHKVKTATTESKCLLQTTCMGTMWVPLSTCQLGHDILHNFTRSPGNRGVGCDGLVNISSRPLRDHLNSGYLSPDGNAHFLHQCSEPVAAVSAAEQLKQRQEQLNNVEIHDESSHAVVVDIELVLVPCCDFAYPSQQTMPCRQVCQNLAAPWVGMACFRLCHHALHEDNPA